MSSVRKFLALVIASWLLAGCGIVKDSDADVAPTLGLTGGTTSTAVQAYRLSVYTLTQNQCASCHGGGTGPQFVTSDILASYSMAKNYANFTDISNSRFVTRMMDGHCGSSCQTNGLEMEAAIQYWWDNGEFAESQNLSSAVGQYVTSEILIPSPLPTGNTFTTLSFNLGNVRSDLAGCTFQIDVQQFAADAYRFRRPRLFTTNRAVAVRDIKPLLNGNYDILNNGYVPINTVVPPNSNVILTTAFLIAIVDNGAGSDLLSLAFGNLSPQ